MQFDLTATLQQLASLLQSVSLAVPISQLTLVSWLVFAACGSFRSQGAVQRH